MLIYVLLASSFTSYFSFVFLWNLDKFFLRYLFSFFTLMFIWLFMLYCAKFFIAYLVRNKKIKSVVGITVLLMFLRILVLKFVISYFLGEYLCFSSGINLGRDVKLKFKDSWYSFKRERYYRSSFRKSRKDIEDLDVWFKADQNLFNMLITFKSKYSYLKTFRSVLYYAIWLFFFFLFELIEFLGYWVIYTIVEFVALKFTLHWTVHEAVAPLPVKRMYYLDEITYEDNLPNDDDFYKDYIDFHELKPDEVSRGDLYLVYFDVEVDKDRIKSLPDVGLKRTIFTKKQIPTKNFNKFYLGDRSSSGSFAIRNLCWYDYVFIFLGFKLFIFTIVYIF